MVCGQGVFFRMAVLQLSWMMPPRWQGLRVTPRLRVRSLEAESRNSQARVGLLQIRCPGGHQARAFIARGHKLRCGMLWSPRFAVVRLRRPAQRYDFVQGTSPSTARDDHVGSRTVHDCAAERVAPHTRRRLGEHAQTVYDQPKWCAIFFAS